MDCRSVAFTYNDPVIFAEYAMDTADACHALGIKTVAVTAGYIGIEARREFYAKMDAANVDLKAFTDEFYVKLCGAHLQPVQDTLVYLKRETDVWFEITTLLIPGRNDSDAELEAMCAWIVRELGTDVPLHFTAFHPDYKMTNLERTPGATLSRARAIALKAGIGYVYTGNVHDRTGGTTFCPGCSKPVIVRDWHEILDYALTPEGRCHHCDAQVPGRFDVFDGQWGRHRVPVRVSVEAASREPRAGVAVLPRRPT
jgi:pyruvate formate lyase activating enzyme